MESNNKLTVLDLFSGIGGFSLGLESTGHYKICCSCKESSDIIEKQKSYCASCYFRCVLGKTIEEYEKELKERELKYCD